MHNIHRLAWSPYGRGAPGNCPVCPSVNTPLDLLHSRRTRKAKAKITPMRFVYIFDFDCNFASVFSIV
jgi:hypothetical protein